MDLIRTSWNNHLSSDEFQQAFSQQKDPLLIINQLFNIIGQFSGKEKIDFKENFFQNHDDSQMPILYDYLFVSLYSSPHFLVNSILDYSPDGTLKKSSVHFNLNQNLNLLGLVRFLSQYGDQLFESYNNSDLNIDIKQYSFCCLLILQTCISFGFSQYSLDYSNYSDNDEKYMNSYEFHVSEIAISKLSSSLQFIITIAHSRLFYKNEIMNTRKILQKRIELTSKFFEKFLGEEDETTDFALQDEICFDESDKCEMLLSLNGLNTWRVLKFIIFSDRPYINSRISLMPRSEVMLFIVSDLRTIHTNPNLFEYASIDHLYNFYIQTISQFMSFPSLYLGYMTSTFLVQYISYAEKKLLKNSKDTVILSTFDAQKVHELFSHIKKFSVSKSSPSSPLSDHLFEENISNPTFSFSQSDIQLNINTLQTTAFEGQLGPRSCVFGYGLNYDKYESFFSQIPSDDFINSCYFSIYSSVFQYPAFMSSAGNILIQRIEADDIHFCAKIAQQVLESYETLQDFRIYIFKYGTFFALIMQLLRLSSITTDEALFYPIWLLALSLLRFTWGSGSLGIYARSVIFVESVEPLPIRYFLRFLLQIEPGKEDLPSSKDARYIIEGKDQEEDDFLGISSFYPFYNAAKILDDLIKGRYHFSDVIQIVSNHQYLWPSILLYVYKFPTNENKTILTSIKQPNEELVKLLFKQVMLRIAQENISKKWIAASEMLDLMVMRENPPNSPHDIKFIISKHIQILMAPDTLRCSKIIGMSNIWIALSEHFGFDVFGKIFIHEIVRIMSTFDSYDGIDDFSIQSFSFDNNSSLSSFICSIGHIYGIFLNSESNMMTKSIDMIIDIVDNETDLLSNTGVICAFAQFTVILINDSKENWKPIFTNLIKKYNDMLINSATNLTNKKCLFALYLIRISLIIPKFRDFLVNDNMTFQTLIKLNDCATIIDYIIAKDLSINI